MSRRSSRLSTTLQTNTSPSLRPSKRKRSTKNDGLLPKKESTVQDNTNEECHNQNTKVEEETDVNLVPSPTPSVGSNQENIPVLSESDGKELKAPATSAKSPAPVASGNLPEVKSQPNTPNLNTIISDVVTKHIKDEEEKLQKLNSEKEESETKTFLQEWEQAEEREKEERYAKLQLLLTKSEMYTKYLLERMDQQKQMIAEVKKAELESTSKTGPPAKKQRQKHKTAGSSTSKESLNQSLNQSSEGLSQSSASSSAAELALHNGCPLLFTGELRPYQIDGLVWLNTMFENGVNGILADEMGLGKTIQCIAAIAHLITMNVKGPFLVVVPLSTLPNWVNEFKKFAPKVPVMLYHGTKPEREVLINDIYKSTEVDGTWWTQPVVCTSYEVAMMDRKYLMSMQWKYLIVDEGHRIKNSQCRLIKELRMYDSTHRVLLTGTPLQNNLSELWSLLNFLLPEVFDDLDSFEYWFKLDCLRSDQRDQLIAEEKKRNILAMLHKIMTPFLLRRLKSDVELNLPPKQEVMVYAPLTDQQRKFYEATVDKTINQMLLKEDKSELLSDENLIIPSKKGERSRRTVTQNSKINYLSQGDADEVEYDDDNEGDIDDWVTEIMELTERRSAGAPKSKKMKSHANNVRMQNPMMQLRKCCSHPYLLSQPIDPETGYCKIDEEVVNTSGKMLLLDAMLTELKKKGHKVLIFSQMTKMLDLIEDYCYIRQHEYCRLDGSTRLEERQEQMHLFNTDSDCFLFLLSTRAGGLGINLVSADTVIIYDSDWNPQCDLQAQDRAHRIGQTSPVMIYRLICANTIDEKIVERASRKRRLEKMIIHKEKFKTGMTREYAEKCKSITPAELLELLKSHDHDAVVTVDSKREVISKRDLNALLDRSHLIKQWQENKDKAAGKKKNTKSKTKPAKKSASAEDTSKVFKVIEEEEAESPENDEAMSEVSDGVKSEVSR